MKQSVFRLLFRFPGYGEDPMVSVYGGRYMTPISKRLVDGAAIMAVAALVAILASQAQSAPPGTGFQVFALVLAGAYGRRLAHRWRN